MTIYRTPRLGRLLRRACASLLAVPLVAASVITPIAALTPNGTGLVIRDWLTNDTAYTFSDVYKTSVWYDNFSELSLSDNDRNNVLRIAMSQLGYHEGNSAADLDGENRNGSQNYIEYARLLFPPYNNNSYEWCACFVNWCLNQADIDYAYGEISCISWVRWLKQEGLFQHSLAYGGSYTPQPADFIFFSWDRVNTTSNHIGLVLYTTSTHVYTIEGNTSDCVGLRSYPLNDSCIIGYGTPEYVIGKERTISYKPQDQRLPGAYIVTVPSGAYVRLYGSKSSSAAYTTIPNGAMVYVDEPVSGSSTWVAVRYADQVGYVNTSGCTVSLLSPATYSLVYDARGGSNPPAPIRDFCYTEHRISDVEPIRDNAVFLGWSYTSDAGEHDDLLAPGDSLILNKETVTLYAVWKEIPVETTETETETETETDTQYTDNTESEGSSSDTTVIPDDDTEWDPLSTTTNTPETLTTITGGSDLPGATGCGAVIPSITSVCIPLSLASLLVWKRTRDRRDEDSQGNER